MSTPWEKPLSSSYDPENFETETYAYWERAGHFRASDITPPGHETFSIVIPPPNVTGVLHMGHALTVTIEDILTRWHRMKGDNTLWLPGTDHAGIATQAQVEKAIAKEGKGPSGRPLTRHDLGRDAFLKRTWKWKEDHESEIKNQLRRLGASVDWKRDRFTMDEGMSRATREVFVRLYEEGLIYRGERIINWCPRCQTALSDLETIPTERKGHFWHLIYKIEGEKTELVIATTRPETLLGDTAVAVHPEDERYRHLHGKKAILPLLGRRIPVVADDYVDREFGSGALKVTPAHDFNDYEIGKRHGLDVISVMGKDGRIAAEGGPYSGLKFQEAREKIVEDLKAAGLLVKVEDHLHKVGLCQRCDQVAEPIISEQWFVKIAPLAKPAIEAVETGKIEFRPKNWEKTYFEWMRNIRDWCISRQLWWGHQIPAWYCDACGETIVARETPCACAKCGGKLRQDEDVLDTWFSSALWPFGTLGWPGMTQTLKTFYPTSILETGFDIIFFWVARMIMMGIHFMGDVPFRRVYLHAMVRDEKGEKMSKSRGNVIDPLIIADKFGADSLRFTLAAMAGQGRDIKLSVDRVEGYRAFCNKLWNAVKFFHLQFDAIQPSSPGDLEEWLAKNQSTLTGVNDWILSRFEKTSATVERGLENFELNESANALYEFVWHELCDWYIEFTKYLMREKGPLQTETLYVLGHVLEKTLLLLHPFVPFVTEKLWQSLPWRADGVLMLQSFPRPDGKWIQPEAERTIQSVQAIVSAIRNFRGENGIAYKTRFTVNYVPSSDSAERFVQQHLPIVLSLTNVANLQKISRLQSGKTQEAVIPILDPAIELFIPLEGLVDLEEEAKRLKKEVEKVSANLEFVKKKLSQDTFISKAPPALVEKERERAKEMSARLNELQTALKRLSHAAKG